MNVNCRKVTPTTGRWTACLGTLLIAVSSVAQDKPKIVFDTDMFTDFDDVGALACLHALADEGRCEILATVSSTRGTPSVGVCEVINAWYGRGDLPVGAPREIGVCGSDDLGYAYPLYSRLVRERKAPHQSSDSAPDANEVYRRVLAAQPDGSVTICSVGFTTNLRRLLETKGDAYSPLDGKTLVAKKVKAWYAMACRYPEGIEFNSSRDAESSLIAFRDWPTPVYFADWWLGGAVRCGESVASLAEADNPVSSLFRESLEKFNERGKGHPAWDQVTVLAAVCGGDGHFGEERGMFRIVGKDGRNVWTADANGPHRRLFARTTSRRLGEILDELMARPPANRSAAAFDRTFDAPQDVSVVVPHDDSLLFAEGFAATIRLACDFDRLGGRKGACCNLVTKGDDYTDGYSIMIRWDGRLMVHRKGGRPEYWAGDVGLKSGVTHTLRICEAKDCVRVFVDDVERQAFTSRGPRQMADNVAPLHVGSMKNYPFFGRLERVRIEPASAVSLPPLTAVPEKRQARAEIKWVRTICAEENRYIGWPTVCRLQNGDLLAVFSGDRDSHICPWGKVQMVRSTDDGESWSKPVTISNGPLDDRDAGIVQLPSGEIVVTYFTSVAYRDPAILAKHPEYARHDSKITSEVSREALGYFRIASHDDGRTWSKPEKMNVSHAPHGPSLMRDGSLLQVGRTFRRRESLGELGEDQQTVIRAERSTDGGRTWKILCGEIPDVNGENRRPHMFHEPHVVELPNGELLAMVRYHGDGEGLARQGNGYMRQMRSSDGGATWTPMTSSGILGLPPHLLVLPDGKVVCVYGRRLADPGFGEFAVLSEDGGRTWDLAHEVVLAKSHCGDLGYPASTLLPNGDILTVYYQQPAPGERPALMATKWRVTR